MLQPHTLRKNISEQRKARQRERDLACKRAVQRRTDTTCLQGPGHKTSGTGQHEHIHTRGQPYERSAESSRPPAPQNADPAMSSTQKPGHLRAAQEIRRGTPRRQRQKLRARYEREQAKMQTQRHASANWQCIVLQRTCATQTHAQKLSEQTAKRGESAKGCGPWRLARCLRCTDDTGTAQAEATRPHSRHDISGKPTHTTWT